VILKAIYLYYTCQVFIVVYSSIYCTWHVLSSRDM